MLRLGIIVIRVYGSWCFVRHVGGVIIPLSTQVCVFYLFIRFKMKQVSFRNTVSSHVHVSGSLCWETYGEF